MSKLVWFVALTLAPALPPQGSIVYPIANATVEGTTYDDVPFSAAKIRLQSILRESKGRQHAVKALTFRRDGLVVANAGPRTIEVEVKIGRGDWKSFGGAFAANWVTAPSVAITRKRISLPDWSQRPANPPAAFTARLPFDAAYAHNGQGELLYEILIYSNTRTDLYPADGGGTGTYTSAIDAALGTGCTTNTSGPGRSYTLFASFRSNGPDSFLDLGAFWAPANVQVDVLVGLRDPNLAYPGLCTRLRTDNLVRIQAGRADVGGSLLTRTFPVGAWKGSWANVKLYVQAVSLDATKPVPVALSQGIQMALPAMVPNAPTTIMIEYSSNPSSTSGTVLDGGPVVKIDT